MPERRKETRLDEENRILIESVGNPKSGNPEAISALTQNLSVGGAKIISDTLFPVDTELKMTLILTKSRQTIKVIGKVIWVKDIDKDLYEMGVEFKHKISKTVLGLILHLYRKAKGIPPIDEKALANQTQEKEEKMEDTLEKSSKFNFTNISEFVAKSQIPKKVNSTFSSAYHQIRKKSANLKFKKFEPLIKSAGNSLQSLKNLKKEKKKSDPPSQTPP